MKYEYAGNKITPRIIEALAFEFYGGQQVARSEFKSFILNYHSENGGIADKKDNKYLTDTLSLLVRKNKIKETNGLYYFPEQGNLLNQPEAERGGTPEHYDRLYHS